MPESLIWLAVVVAAFLAGALNTLAGGGSILTLPVLVLVAGLPANVANGTNRVAVLAQSVVAALVFRQGRLGGTRIFARLAPLACVGALGGAWLATQVPAASMQRIMGGALLLCAPLVFVRTSRFATLPEGSAPPVPSPLIWFAALLLGVYGGFLQAGIGLFIILLGSWAFRMSLLDANNTKVLLVGVLTLVALALFVAAGQVDPFYALLLGVGEAAGSFVGAKLAIRRGEAFLRWAIALAVAASALQMLGVIRLGR